MITSETHSSASVDTIGFEDGSTEGSVVANKLRLLMCSIEKVRGERLVDNLSTMEQRFHENPVLAAKGHMQHTEGLTKYTDNVKFALQLKLDRTGSFMTASETHLSASVEKKRLALRMVGWRIAWWPTSLVC